VDYPIGYVRWTEKRNMEEFLNLVANGKVNVKSLITHKFPIKEAEKAYKVILGETNERYIGVLINYEVEQEKNHQSYVLITEKKSALDKHFGTNEPVVGFIGAGNFAQSYLLPILKDLKIYLKGVATSTPVTAKSVGKKFNFEYCTTEASQILNDPEINTIFITTRHNTHARYVIEAIEKGKHVFVEKPLAITEGELIKIVKTFKDVPPESRKILTVGFNRRFSPHINKIKEKINTYPIAINYRINAGFIPPDHWTQIKDVGGGRIIGEVCHFVDLCQYLANSRPIKVTSFLMDDPLNTWDTLVINLKFENGSIATISYFANGNKNIPKEYLEVYSGGNIFILDDFKKLLIQSPKRKEKFKTKKQDKGHKNELIEFINAIRDGKESPIPLNDIFISSLIPFKIIESIQNSAVVELEDINVMAL